MLNPLLLAHDESERAPKAEMSGAREAIVQQALEEALASPPFCHTQQCQNLLRYIVKHSLSQEEHLLRERVIGAEVFGRRPDYDTGEDPVVRIRAADVRKRLAQFYQATAESAHPPDVQIDIPSGSYRASFRWRDASRSFQDTLAAGGNSTAQEPASLETNHSLELPYAPLPLSVEKRTAWQRVPSTLRWMVPAILLFVCAVAGVRMYKSNQQRAFQVFWGPWVHSAKPVIISIGSNAVYRVLPDIADRYAREHNLEAEGMEFYLPSGPGSNFSGSDVEPAWNSFVALGDVSAVSNLVATLTKQNQSFQERFPYDISFAELRSSPTILVGGFNNSMRIELEKNLPFVAPTRNEIDDTRTPGRRWIVHNSAQPHDNSEDYAIITRWVQVNGDGPILSVGGMGAYGTVAAAQFICDPAAIARLDRQLPKGWENRNLQLVLHVRVVDYHPASSEVVAVQTW